MVSGFVTSVVGKLIAGIAGKYVVRARVRYTQRMNDPFVNIWIITEQDGTVLSAHLLGMQSWTSRIVLTYRECFILFGGHYTNSWQACLYSSNYLRM